MHRDRCQRINGEGVGASKGGNQQIELSELCYVSVQNNLSTMQDIRQRNLDRIGEKSSSRQTEI